MNALPASSAATDRVCDADTDGKPATDVEVVGALLGIRNTLVELSGVVFRVPETKIVPLPIAQSEKNSEPGGLTSGANVTPASLLVRTWKLGVSAVTASVPNTYFTRSPRSGLW